MPRIAHAPTSPLHRRDRASRSARRPGGREGWLPPRAAGRAAALLLPMLAAPIAAQTLSGRPLRTEAATALPFGVHAVEIGAEWRSGFRPVALLDTGAEGDLLLAPVVRYRAGLGRAELQVGGALHQDFSPEAGESESEVGDLAFWVKVEALRDRPGRPGLGVLLGAKMPNASDESGLGSDEADVFLGLVLSNTGEAHDVRLNVGLGVLGDPLEERSQVDVLTWGIGGRHGRRHSLLWEAWGRSFDDDERDVEEATARLGYAWRNGRFELDASLLGGLADASGDLGLTTGVTWTLGSPRSP